MKRILVLPGGGMLGLPQATALMALRQMAGRPLHDVVDLAAGTSIGGIAALITACDDVDITRFFTDDGPIIFKKGWFPNYGIWGPVYQAGPIEDRLQARFAGKTVADLKTKTLVTGLDARSKKPFFLRNWDPSNLIENRATPLWKIARFTSAAEHYFPGFCHGNRVIWDGGNVANNPALVADEAADLLWGKDEDRKFLVLGCGVDTGDDLNYENPSVFTLLKIMVKMLFDAAAEDVTETMLEAYGSSRYIECQPTFSRSIEIDDASPAALAVLNLAAAKFVEDNRANFTRFLA